MAYTDYSDNMHTLGLALFNHFGTSINKLSILNIINLFNEGKLILSVDEFKDLFNELNKLFNKILLKYNDIETKDHAIQTIGEIEICLGCLVIYNDITDGFIYASTLINSVLSDNQQRDDISTIGYNTDDDTIIMETPSESASIFGDDIDYGSLPDNYIYNNSSPNSYPPPLRPPALVRQYNIRQITINFYL
jgi:hypothetical protein